MRKIINAPENVVKESLEGFIGANAAFYRKHPKVNGVLYKRRRKNKVALVIGGGSGHEPMFAGFVGEGLADAAACGGIFASPDPATVYETAKAVNEGCGVLFVYGCYAGDNLNFDMAEEMLQKDGIPTAHVRVQDDVASAPRSEREKRRGIAGDVFVVKTAGAACDAGLSLEEVTRITEKANERTYSIGVATASAQLPGVEEPIFTLEEGKIEYGMGLHGEKGIRRVDWAPMDELVNNMYAEIKKDAAFEKGDEVCVLLNSLGATTIIELSIAFRHLKKLLEEDGIAIYDSELNNYCTSQEMGGFSITLLKLDEELKQCYDHPCRSPYYSKAPLSGEEREEDKVLDVAETETAAGEASAYVRKDSYEALDAEDVRAMLLYVSEKLIASEPMLTKADSEIGDGDHGLGMKTGMMSVKSAMQKVATDGCASDVFGEAGQAMLTSMGGASGVIFGSLFLAGAQGEKKKTMDAKALAEMFEKSLQAIRERGGASVGDKTMVDALSPAVDAMKEAADKGLAQMLTEGEKAAHAGSDATKDQVAKFGRARTLGERALGFADAGSISTWLIIQAMRDFVIGE